MATIAELRVELFDIAPELETSDSTKIARYDRFLQRAIDAHDEDCYFNESQYKYAMASYAAWQITVADPTITPTANVSKVKVGRLETTFASGGNSTENKYKQMYDAVPCATIPMST